MQPCSCYVFTYMWMSFKRKKEKCNKPKFAFVFLQETTEKFIRMEKKWLKDPYFQTTDTFLNILWVCRTDLPEMSFGGVGGREWRMLLHLNATETPHTTIRLARAEKSRSSLSISQWFTDHCPHDVYRIEKIREKKLSLVSGVDCLVWGVLHDTHWRGNIVQKADFWLTTSKQIDVGLRKYAQLMCLYIRQQWLQSKWRFLGAWS